MTRQKEWNEFLENLFNNAINECQDTEEYRLSKEKQKLLSDRLFEEYPQEKNPLVYEHAFEIVLIEEHKNEFIYRQGLKDCVFLLKQLGVLA